jgi:hypothetical protein
MRRRKGRDNDGAAQMTFAHSHLGRAVAMCRGQRALAPGPVQEHRVDLMQTERGLSLTTVHGSHW